MYEYRCRVCDRSFHRLRSIAAADESTSCPAGHDDVARALSLVAPPRRSGVPAAPSGGGCCGGACGCGH